MGRGTPMRPDTAAPRARPSVVTAFLALIVVYTRSPSAAGASNTASGFGDLVGISFTAWEPHSVEP